NMSLNNKVITMSAHIIIFQIRLIHVKPNLYGNQIKRVGQLISLGTVNGNRVFLVEMSPRIKEKHRQNLLKRSLLKSAPAY
ncbi:hypothetical protein B4903_07660, partial [Yersinia frederiksenii]